MGVKQKYVTLLTFHDSDSERTRESTHLGIWGWTCDSGPSLPPPTLISAEALICKLRGLEKMILRSPPALSMHAYVHKVQGIPVRTVL